VNVPVDPGAGLEAGVVPWEEPGADERGEEEQGVVGYKGDEHFVYM